MINRFVKKGMNQYSDDCLKIKAYSIEEGRNDLIQQLKNFLEITSINFDKTKELIFIQNAICGCSLSIKTFDDIPHESIYCKHGNGMIVYEVLLKDVEEFKKNIIWKSIK